MMKLRHYQERDVENILSASRSLSNNSIKPDVLYTAPVGAGKTAVLGQLVQMLLQENMAGKSVLILAPQTNIIKQIKHTLTDGFGIPRRKIAFISGEASLRRDSSATVQIATPQALISRLKSVKSGKGDPPIINPPVTCFGDEAHHFVAETYEKICNAYPNMNLIGFTGTPYRMDGSPLSPPFKQLVLGPTMRELEDMGYLVKSTYKELYVPEIKHLKVVGEDYDSDALHKAFKDVPYVRTYLEHAKGLRGLGFFASVNHAYEAKAAFTAQSVSAEVVVGDTPQNKRDNIFRRYEKGEIMYLCTVNVMQEGIDLPCIQCLQYCTTSASLVKWVQPHGRGKRVYDPSGDHAIAKTDKARLNAIALSKKPRLLVIDHGGMARKFGPVNYPYDWEAYFNGYTSKSDNVRKQKYAESATDLLGENIYSILPDFDKTGTGQSVVAEFNRGLESIRQLRGPNSTSAFAAVNHILFKARHKGLKIKREEWNAITEKVLTVPLAKEDGSWITESEVHTRIKKIEKQLISLNALTG